MTKKVGREEEECKVLIGVQIIGKVKNIEKWKGK